MSESEGLRIPESEADLLSWVLDLARLRGWRTYHARPGMTSRTTASGKAVWVTPVQGDGAGFLDLVLVRERVLWRELKAEAGRLTEAQMGWIAALTAAGQDAGVWRPGDRETIERELE